MRVFRMISLVALSLVASAISWCQTTSSVWYLLDAPEGDTIVATGPITLRFGQVASTCAVPMSSGPCAGHSGTPTPEAWTSPQTFTPASGETTVTIVVAIATFGGVDPLPGVVKTVEAEEESTTQSLTINGQPVTVPVLSATPTCQLTANPSSISFPNTTLGYSYSSQGSIVNNCTTAISVASFQLTAPFSASGLETPFSVAAGQTQNYTAVFTPTMLGTLTGTITFSGSSWSGEGLSIPLSGTGVPLSGTGVHYVTLSWQETGNQIAGYNAYRSTVSGGPYSTINSSLIASMSYNDASVSAGQTYYYVVTAVSSGGAESAHSNEVTVIVPTP